MWFSRNHLPDQDLEHLTPSEVCASLRQPQCQPVAGLDVCGIATAQALSCIPHSHGAKGPSNAETLMSLSCDCVVLLPFWSCDAQNCPEGPPVCSFPLGKCLAMGRLGPRRSTRLLCRSWNTSPVLGSFTSQLAEKGGASCPRSQLVGGCLAWQNCHWCL